MFRSLVGVGLLSSVMADDNHWNDVVSPDFSQITEAFGVGFAPDGQTGFTGVGINGVGTEIWKTTNGGSNWTSVWPDQDTKATFNLFLSAAATSTTSAVVTGALAQAFTVDGTKFKDSDNEYLDPCQDIEITPSGLYGIVVSGEKVNGIATSKTGEKWSNMDIGQNSTLYPARYGAFPSDSTYYVAAGAFPVSQADSNVRQINQNFGRNMLTGESVLTFAEDELIVSDAVNCSTDPLNCFSAGIFKTTDSGNTWTQVFENINTGDNIYPNDIDCLDENNCVAVLEGDTCRIINTNDGGKTWTETSRDTDPACSLMYASYVSSDELWVAGGLLKNQLSFEGRFWHSIDGAKTWTKEVHKGLYIVDLEIEKTFGYAIGIGAQNGATLLKYTE